MKKVKRTLYVLVLTIALAVLFNSLAVPKPPIGVSSLNNNSIELLGYKPPIG